MTTQPSPPSRILGLDVARALAILGMVMVHFGPFSPDTSTPVGWLYRTSYGRASMLFVMLAGVGVTLLFDGTTQRGAIGERRKDPRLAWTKVGWRVVLFLPLGVLLQGLDTPVAVIIQYYAAYYVVAALASRLPSGWLVATTTAWIIIGPTIYLTIFDPSLAGRGAADDMFNPFGVLSDILLTGFYPVITWAPAVLIGVLIGRADLRDTATQWALATGGSVTAAAAYGTSEIARASSSAAAASPYLLAEGHTGATLNILGASGVAVGILGLSLLVASVAPRLIWPLAAVGQMALTVYVGHLLVLHVAPDLLEARDAVGPAIVKVLRFFLVTGVLCVAWRARFAQGPLERVLALPFPSRGTVARLPQQPDQAPSPTAGSTPWQHPPPTTLPDRSAVPSTTAPRPSPPSTPTSSSWSGTPPPNG